MDTGFGKDLHPFRHIARSLIEMALVTGALVRVLHAVFNAHGEQLDWHAIVGRFILIPVVLLGMATVHLAQYPVRQWIWRAPVFAAAEVAVGAIASLVLIAMGRERVGTVQANFGDWPVLVLRMFGWHLLLICLFSLTLGMIVQWVRRRELVAEHVHEHLMTHPPGKEGTILQKDPEPVEGHDVR